MTFFDYSSNYLILATYNCLSSFIIFGTLGHSCHVRPSVFYQFLPEWMFFKIIIFVERKKICDISNILQVHNTKYMWNNYSTTWSSGEPEVLCRTATTPMYLDLLFWILHRLIQNKLFVWRIIFENLSFEKRSNISKKERLLS